MTWGLGLGQQDGKHSNSPHVYIWRFPTPGSGLVKRVSERSGGSPSGEFWVLDAG